MSCKFHVAALLAGLLCATGVSAQPEDEPLPTLDELLGLDGEDEQEKKPKTDAADAELERVLEQQKPIADEFLEAVGLMRESAKRLSDSTDTGIVTQRLQEDILRRLDELIDRAGEQSSSSSSSSQSDQQQQQQQQPNQQRRDESQANANDNQTESDAPGQQDARLGAQATLDGARWGNLPERLRDALLQGSSDSYSSLYKAMTESYYRRLAEEASE